MRARLALLVLVAAALVIVALIWLPSGRRPAAPPRPRPRPVAASAKQAAVTYLGALRKRDWRAAYALLSADSQAAHPMSEFAAACEKAGAPSLDVAAAEEKQAKGGAVTVVVPMVEDPANAAISMVMEKGEWRVVFIKGSPWFPYPQ
jgi:hypothetical protein